MAAKKFTRLVSGIITEILGIQTSAGAGNAGDIPALDDDGVLDKSLVPRVPVRIRPVFCDDFLSNQIQRDWLQLNTFSSGDTGFVPAAADMVANHRGIVRLRCGTTANGGCYASTNSSTIVLLGGEECSFIFKTPSSFLSTQVIRCGFGDTLTSAAVTDGAILIVDGTGVVIGATYNNGSSSTTSTITTLSTATWYRMKVTVNSNATSINFAVYSDAGSLIADANLTTNIPTSSRPTGVEFIVHSTGTTGADLAILDYMEFQIPDIVR